MVWNNNIIELIKSRAASGSLPGKRDDDRWLALAIEGGGMRGVVAAGMAVALEEMNFRESFDSVYGCSAGALIGAYFVAGQAGHGIPLFYDHINNDNFINMRRLGSSKPVLSLEYLLQICFGQKALETETGARPPVQLNTEAVLNSNIPLKIIASSVKQRRSVILSNFADDQALYAALMASACIPIFAGPPIAFKDDLYLDGALYESIPHASARREGATDFIVLRTCPKDSIQESVHPLVQRLARKHLSADIFNDYLLQDKRCQAEIQALENDTRTLVIQLDKGQPCLSPFQLLRDPLIEGALAGYAATYRAFGLTAPKRNPFVDPAGYGESIYARVTAQPALATGMPI